MTKLAVLTTILLVFASCSDDNEPEATISAEEAAEIVAGAVAENTQGLTAQIEDSAEDAEELTDEIIDNGRTAETASCGLDSTATFDLESLQGGLITFDYVLSYSYELSCNQFLIPTSMDFSFTQSGSADAQRYASNANSDGEWTLDGLQISSLVYGLSGSYERSGTHTSKVRNQNEVVFDLEMNLNDLTIDKGNLMVLSGSADFIITSTPSSPGDGTTVTGLITYLGQHQIEVTINNETFIIDLRNGEII